MPTPLFVPANPRDHLDALLSINLEYVSWVFAEMERSFGVTASAMTGQSVGDYVSSSIPKVCGETPPRGIFYLIYIDDQVAGMCGLRFVRSGMAEFKRIYVRPAFRGLQLGGRAIRRLMSDAVAFGYRSACLDTAPFMQSAQRLYESNGFVDCDPYEGVEVPTQYQRHWRFMQCTLPLPSEADRC